MRSIQEMSVSVVNSEWFFLAKRAAFGWCIGMGLTIMFVLMLSVIL